MPSIDRIDLAGLAISHARLQSCARSTVYLDLPTHMDWIVRSVGVVASFSCAAGRTPDVEMITLRGAFSTVREVSSNAKNMPDEPFPRPFPLHFRGSHAAPKHIWFPARSPSPLNIPPIPLSLHVPAGRPFPRSSPLPFPRVPTGAPVHGIPCLPLPSPAGQTALGPFTARQRGRRPCLPTDLSIARPMSPHSSLLTPHPPFLPPLPPPLSTLMVWLP
jgi:hypothetical protein